ncbi:DUF4132 domain-containing protein [Streptomyces griseoviridis]|uniref:DUF4132 domain-containing protein n=1 Tax=Streptomyces griseoviridis TaxID=45398 RepID=A0A918G8H0_STRGD|nr:DUF4132 domain-containing protein [Streptomyces niveoruber]GGS24664.1 hypothetical protein GCM10010238_11020 [Streptomyces niveoruber]
MGTARSLRDRLRDRFAAGEPERAAEELLKGLDGGHAHRDRGGWGQVLDLLRGLPAESRGALLRTVADRFPARYGEDGADVEERLRILSLCAVAGEGLPDDPLAAGRTAALADLGRLHRTWDTPLLDAVVAAEPAAGRSLTPATVAAIRRTGQDRYAPAELAALARTLTGPVLNAGEDWADQALRDATDPELRALLAHCRTATAAGYADGALRTLTGTPVTDGTEVALWHPVGADPAETVAWRDWLERHGVTQPFKQAHREVYPLTDAERATGTYSNRFAAHVLRQHQFHSLAAVRGWRNKLRLCVDDEAPPATRDLPAWGLRAEFWVQGDGGEYLEDTTESGSFLRLRTDQVRFYPIDAPENSAHCSGGAYRMWLRDGRDPVDPLPLDAVPPLVLSEVLRDVDLFVGMASVGNDPTWQDGGPGGRFREYWTSYGFGELNQSARTRRELLERLIPRLAIAGRCRLEGRFLHVKGERHTYRIHLGSGNILRSPDDRYLCIVPRSGAGPAETGYLPFEGDRTLAVILSKALMLADDTSITDPTVLSQL